MNDLITSFPIFFLKIVSHAIPFIVIAAIVFHALPIASPEIRGALALATGALAVLGMRWGVKALWRHLWKEDTWYRR